MRLGYFVTESSEHFAEYTPWFIKRDRPDLIERFGIPLDEYPKRCVEQIARWDKQAQEYRDAEKIEVKPVARVRVDHRQLGGHGRAFGDLRQRPEPRLHPAAPRGLRGRGADPRGRQRPPAHGGAGPARRSCVALQRTNINVQELTVAALLTENREHIYHAAMMDPHTGAELDLDQIWALVDDLLVAHGEFTPAWARPEPRRKAS